MKLTVNAVLDGEDIVKNFLDLLSQNNIKAEGKDINIIVKSKDGKDVEITADRLKLVFNQG